MKEQRIEYDAKTGEKKIVEEIVEEIIETAREIIPTVDEKIVRLQNTDTEHELALVELANMIMEIIGGGENA